MFSALAIIMIVAGTLLFAFEQRGKWKQRARSAEMKNKTTRKAHEIKNRVIYDSRFHERVRRKFDRR